MEDKDERQHSRLGFWLYTIALIASMWGLVGYLWMTVPGSDLFGIIVVAVLVTFAAPFFGRWISEKF